MGIATKCSGLKATLAPNDLGGRTYTLTVSGSITAGSEKVIYSLFENESPDFNPTILTLHISPEPTEGKETHQIKNFSKNFEGRPEITTININDGSGVDCKIDVEEIFS